MVHDESYNHHLALIGEMTFNVKELLISPFSLVSQPLFLTLVA
jgi:hypothetical protein